MTPASSTGMRGFLIVACLATAPACTPDIGEPEPPVSRAPAQRVIALAPHLTEMLYTAGAGEQIIGAVDFSDFPPQARDLPRVGDAFRLDYEVIAALEPDLILGWVSGNPAPVLARLHQLGYRVVALESGSLEDIPAQLRTIGGLTGHAAVAERAADEYDRDLAALRERYGGRGKVSVLYQLSSRPMLTINRRHPIGQGIEICGGRNVFGDIDALTPAVSIEAVLERAPEVIIASDADAAAGALPESLTGWQRWSNLPAVRDGNLYVVAADLIARPSTRILSGVRSICEHLDAARMKKTARVAL